MVKNLVVAERVRAELRLDALPRHFGTQLTFALERAIFRTIQELATDYQGGYWHFYDLSNGGFYMAPDVEPLRVRVSDGQFCEVLSADAAGIIACLFAYGRLSGTYGSQMLLAYYERLRDFAQSHQEATHILRAID
jgi:antirestriction protein